MVTVLGAPCKLAGATITEHRRRLCFSPSKYPFPSRSVSSPIYHPVSLVRPIFLVSFVNKFDLVPHPITKGGTLGMFSTTHEVPEMHQVLQENPVTTSLEGIVPLKGNVQSEGHSKSALRFTVARKYRL